MEKLTSVNLIFDLCLFWNRTPPQAFPLETIQI